MNRPILHILTTIALIFGVTATAQAQISSQSNETTTNSNAENFLGTYHRVNSNLSFENFTFSMEGDKLFLCIAGLYDFVFGCQGIKGETEYGDNSISFDCMLTPDMGGEPQTDVPAHITLTHLPNGLYEMQIKLKQSPNNLFSTIEGTTTLFKEDGFRISGTVPAKIGNKVTIAGLLKAFAQYVFTPEMLATVNYLKTHAPLAETEAVRQDERNRYLEYAWGMSNACMECKYWPTSDGKILLVVNTHDATYQYPQSLRFILFDKNAGTLQELPTALSDKWPLGEDNNNNGICYQVRYYSDGLVALVPQTNGDSLDVVTLKFDGKIFK